MDRYSDGEAPFDVYVEGDDRFLEFTDPDYEVGGRIELVEENGENESYFAYISNALEGEGDGDIHIHVALIRGKGETFYQAYSSRERSSYKLTQEETGAE